MRFTLITTTAISLFLTCFASADKPAIQRQHAADRFRIASVQEKLILLDSATGDTWMLDYHQDGKKLRWLAIDRQNQMVNRPSDAKAQAAPSKPKELTVDFAPEAGAIIVKGNGKDITKTIGLLQKSDFGTSGGPRMTANFFPDLDFGHISIRGQRSDKGQIQRLIRTDEP